MAKRTINIRMPGVARPLSVTVGFTLPLLPGVMLTDEAGNALTDNETRTVLQNPR